MPRKRATVHVAPNEESEAGSAPVTPSRKSTRTKKQIATRASGQNTVQETTIVEETHVAINSPSVNRSTKRKRATAKQDVSPASSLSPPPPPSSDDSGKPTAKKPKKTLQRTNTAKLEPTDDAPPVKKTTPRKRQTPAEKAAAMAPLAPRTRTAHPRLGAHVSAAGGVHNTITNALHIGANAFACFLKSQRKWENPALKDEHAHAFADACHNEGYDPTRVIIPHGSYLVNLANPDDAKRAQAYASFVDDLRRCERLGIRLYNFHPGNTNGAPRPEALARLAACLNAAHAETHHVVTLLENMAAPSDDSSNTLGGAFADLRAVIDQITDKTRVGVCLDTCHAFAAGYDLRTPSAFAATLADFDNTVGLSYLRAIHLNDSKGPWGSHKDLHANIGTGFLGLRAFHNVVNAPQLRDVPMVLETPIDVKDERGKAVEDKSIWAREVKLLEGLVGMDVESAEFQRQEEELAAKGAKERERVEEVVERKKREREMVKGKSKRGKKKKKAESEAEEEEEEED